MACTRGVITWLLTCGVLATRSADAAETIASLATLNERLAATTAAATTPDVGFLSEGNYHAVQNELSPRARPVYFEDAAHLYAAVRSGRVLAGLVSGAPDVTDQAGQFQVFRSGQISVRSMLVRKGDDALADALDAAIVRLVERGGVERLAKAHAPYEALVVHSCKPSRDHFPWPPLAALGGRTTIRVAALGPYDWGGTDGNYTTTPYRGFWPDYYRAIEAEFTAAYGGAVVFERAWHPTSKAVLDSVAGGDADTTEPYMMVGAGHDTVSRKSAFDLSCFTSATQDKYVTRVEPPDAYAQRPTEQVPDQTPFVLVLVIAIAISCCAVVLFLGTALVYLIRRERVLRTSADLHLPSTLHSAQLINCRISESFTKLLMGSFLTRCAMHSSTPLPPPQDPSGHRLLAPDVRVSPVSTWKAATK